MFKVLATFYFGANKGFIKLWLDGVVLLLEGFHGLGSIGWVIRDLYWLDRGSQQWPRLFKVYSANNFFFNLPLHLIYTHTHTQTPFDVLMSHFIFFNIYKHHFILFLISTHTILQYIYIYIYNWKFNDGIGSDNVINVSFYFIL